jgi:hypothetical protein
MITSRADFALRLPFCSRADFVCLLAIIIFALSRAVAVMHVDCTQVGNGNKMVDVTVA